MGCRSGTGRELNVNQNAKISESHDYVRSLFDPRVVHFKSGDSMPLVSAVVMACWIADDGQQDMQERAFFQQSGEKFSVPPLLTPHLPHLLVSRDNDFGVRIEIKCTGASDVAALAQNKAHGVEPGQVLVV